MMLTLEPTTRRIHQLPVGVITKIAAGEVIERPASVVKELLENSVDAGSTRIDVEIEQGGAELIRVADDGGGIHPDDLPLAFSNHATSKLADADDLFAVRTMGFRGEALASIGGVAQVTLQSRLPTELSGAEISCQGGDLSALRPCSLGPGTRIEVRHLFYNTPVRRKFLKSPVTEMGHICEVFTRLALAKPGLHLSLRHNNKMVYEVTGDTTLPERLGLFFGADLADKLYAIDERRGPAHLFGFIADPSLERGNARMQYLFLNGRWIRDRSLGHAMQEAYRGLLMTGRYAVAFLFLEVPPDQVDVNVHPTKSEVRFRDGQAMYSFVLSTIRNRLSAQNLTARLRPPMPGYSTGSTQSWLQPQRPEEARPLFPQTGFPTYTRVEPPTNTTAPSPPHAQPGAAPDPLTPDSRPLTPDPRPPTPESSTPDPCPLAPDFRGEKAIQLHNAYLVLETPEGMLVIDQHALHERILFEQLKARMRDGTLETQRLLIPEPVELSAEQATRLLDQRQELAKLGLGVEDFGGGTVLVTSYPALLQRSPPGEILKSILDHLAAHERLPTREHLLNDLMSLMACHGAVRSGDTLTPEEITALASQRHLAGDAHHCPHGRPTALLFTRQDLDRQFKRI